jgi:RNA polymerase sigma-B factor
MTDVIGRTGPDRTRERQRVVAKTTAGRRRKAAPGDAERRAAMVVAHAGLARSLARRFANRGESLDDLVQVAMVGLLKAVDRFDEDRGVQFSTYATSTITGEIKRHFRDHRWGLHVTRSLQERYLRVRDATDELALQLGRSPTIPEIAEEAGVTDEEVIEAQEVGVAFHLSSLDQPIGPDDADGSCQVGGPDPNLAAAEARVALGPSVAKLGQREQEIIRMRFEEELTQSQIAERVGISQMHVSRLLSAALRRIREDLTSD